MRQGQVQRATSVALSPPKKKINLTASDQNKELESKSHQIKALEIKNATLVEATYKRQDQLNKQANIIGDLRINMNKLEIETKEKDMEIKRITDMDTKLVCTLVSRDDTINDLEEKLIQFLDVQILIEPSLNQDATNVNNDDTPISLNPPDEETDNSENKNAAIILNKTVGYKRVGPQTGARPKEAKGKHEPHIQSRFNCTECSETKISEITLAAHIKCHEEPGENTCDDCTYQSNNRSELRNHLKKTRHTGTQKEFVCHECRLEFHSEEEERTHMNDHVPDGATASNSDQRYQEQEEVEFECPICGFTGKTKSKIEKHMTCHDN